ncbi:SDR family NAD(P)-dependent oxidoreductase [Roseibium litorale]|uniref:SDR family oxidoreductase n=1 Tax=Roseibium litorale TaxID=2803841 RepID=A0ABR9CLK7_9HYPH|nr:SDR family oxidoreductase [Roseibium litorale]
MTDLSGKTALITGASRGIGAAAARHLAASGATVFLTARTQEAVEPVAEAITADGGIAHALACDVSRFADVEAAVRAALAETGRLDILVNNAGLIDPISRLETSDPDAWGKVADVNIKGVYHGLRAAGPVMLEQKSGTIINLSSGAASRPIEGWSHYCASKAAVLSLTRSADLEWRREGIRVLGLSPGTVATGMQASIRASGINDYSRLAPTAHLDPDWVGQAIAWLCGKAGDAYLGEDCSLKDPVVRKALGIG